MKMKIYYTYIYRGKNALVTIEDVNIQRTKEYFERPVKLKTIVTKENPTAKKSVFLEDNFMQIKRQISKQQGDKSLPPEILYMAIEPKLAKVIIERGVVAPKDKLLLLCETMTQALMLHKNKEQCHVLKIDSAKMYKHGIEFSYRQRRDMWCTKSIDSRYITLVI